MRRIACLSLVLLAGLAACGAEDDLPPVETVTSDFRFTVCEDLCTECQELRCDSPNRTICIEGAHNCAKPRPVACICCGENECRSGDEYGGFCMACPSGEVCDDRSNQCCLPLAYEQACGDMQCGYVDDGCGREILCGMCPTGQECNGGDCCQPRTCGTRRVGQTCGVQDNGCGSPINCTQCGSNAMCNGSSCVCKVGYKECNGRCIRNNTSCQ
jgi:hypothetical protein